MVASLTIHSFVTSTHPGFRIWVVNPHELSFGLYRSNAIGGSH
jgi:hypothetical protein